MALVKSNSFHPHLTDSFLSLSFVSDDLPNEEGFRDLGEKVIFITILHFKRCKVIETELWKCPVKNICSSWICTGVSPASVCRHTMHTHCLQNSEEGVRSPGSGVTHGCELPLGALKEHHQMSPFLCKWYHRNYHDLDRAFHAYVLTVVLYYVHSFLSNHKIRQIMIIFKSDQ